MTTTTDTLAEAMRELMEWQVKNVHCWHNGAYDNAHRALAAFDAQAEAKPAPAEPVAFDAEGFRAWVKRELPDDTIIGSGTWWADHLTAWAQRFVKAAPAAPAPHPDTKDAERWRTFIGLPYEIRAEWAVNLSLTPTLISWVDSATKEQA